jgi:hypothetical protein
VFFANPGLCDAAALRLSALPHLGDAPHLGDTN